MFTSQTILYLKTRLMIFSPIAFQIQLPSLYIELLSLHSNNFSFNSSNPVIHISTPLCPKNLFKVSFPTRKAIIFSIFSLISKLYTLMSQRGSYKNQFLLKRSLKQFSLLFSPIFFKKISIQGDLQLNSSTSQASYSG